MKDDAYPLVTVSADIRNDPRWRNGYLDRFEHQTKSPVAGQELNTDPCATITNWFRKFDRIMIVDSEPTDEKGVQIAESNTAVILGGREYAAGNWQSDSLKGVILDHDPTVLPGVATRFLATPEALRPLLMHPYLPQAAVIDFVAFSLPRPLPILPLLIRAGLYAHRPRQPSPSSDELARLLATALGKEVVTIDDQDSAI